MPETQDGHRKEKSAHEVTEPLDLKPHGIELVAQFPWGVSAAVMKRFIMRTPEKPIGRHGHDDGAARLAHPMQFRQRRQIVIHMLEHVERGYDVKCVVSKTQLLNPTPRQRGKPTLT